MMPAQITETLKKRANHLRESADECAEIGMTEASKILEAESKAWTKAAEEIENANLSVIADTEESGAPRILAASPGINLVTIPDYWEYPEVWTEADVRQTIKEVESTGLQKHPEHRDRIVDLLKHLEDLAGNLAEDDR